MNARFGIIAGLTLIGAFACNRGTGEDLFVEGRTAALDCGGTGCTFSGATQPEGTLEKTPDPNGYDQGGHDDEGYDDHGHGYADAGARCAYDDDCGTGEKCESRHGSSYCEPDDDHPYDDDSDSDDDDYADEPRTEAPGADEPSCKSYDCDDDRRGSNSGPH